MRNLSLSTLLISLSLSSCGYHWQPGFSDGLRPTISVPFVKGDEDGTLTTEIISTLSASGLADVISMGGQYRLEVNVLANSDEKIGFRVDPQKVEGKVRRNLLACEGRKNMTVEATLYRGEKIAYGPFKITTDAEYDYVDGDSARDLTFTNPDGTLVTVLPFSLGQLESVESAKQASTRPLYSRISQKIVDAIFSEW